MKLRTGIGFIEQKAYLEFLDLEFSENEIKRLE